MPLTRRLALAAGLVLASPLSVSAACSVELSPVSFGVIDLARQSKGTGEVVVRCDGATTFQVGISPGGAGDGTRRMSGPDAGRLDYHLFADAGHSIPWGDGQAIGKARAGSSDGGTPTRLTIYGVVPAQSGVPEGEYTDSLQVTLTF
jgi:spore coat protein U-like protein